ncbi:MAG: EAL domain-containing protein, partial [Ruminococcus sp.]|nr:EAL domain-containing protein [Ruminococcus sp.]
NNLFVYHFQPIVSARTGDVLAYEALMRTDDSIGMYPLEILGAATRYGRLYDIEKATMFNTMAFIGENQDIFAGRRLFVNSITAHMLSDADWGTLENRYGELMEKVVIELTEQTEVDDVSLDLIHERLKRCNMSLAIDDYGTGYSNTSNLLRYAPHYVKIDRSLITDINTKPRMQKFVASIIDFVHDNGYQALAEGVETADELRVMIQLGSDLIQGYYVSRPKPVVIHEVAESIRDEIKSINAEFAKDIARIYRSADGDEVRLSELAEEHYTAILAGSGSIVIDGEDSGESGILISVKDGAEAKVTLRNVVINSAKAEPIIALGENTKVEFCIDGENSLLGRGIYVPRSAAVTFTGDGKLTIVCESADAYCVGVGKDNSPGSICFDSPGRFDFTSNGDHSVAIGGGRNEGGLAVIMKQGQFNISCSGGCCVGVGISDGGSVVDMTKVSISVETNSPDSVGIGSISGNANISLTDFRANFNLSGINMCGIGTITAGSGDIDLKNGKLNMIMHGRSINCVGTRKGSIDCRIKHCDLEFECEGNSVSGAGDMQGDGDVYICDGSVDIMFRTNEGLGLGSRDGVLTVDKLVQNININA